ncbi:endonuclease/exonuclease/phosphatase family protein [[Eubacterium] cellulosolvens]
MKYLLNLEGVIKFSSNAFSQFDSGKKKNHPSCQGLIEGELRIDDQVILWKNQSSHKDHSKLLSWCQAVGSPVFSKPTETEKNLVIDKLTLVSWNVHVGSGDLEQFINDLQKGYLTDGKKVEHFVMLLQEAYRQDSSVPVNIPSNAKAGNNIHVKTPRGSRVDIITIARKHGLGLFYVPSMRNGRQENTNVPEDRGNAILSTIPLSNLIAVELPLERQRRTTIAANIKVITKTNISWKIQLINVHLENRTSGLMFFRGFSIARLNQIIALLKILPEEKIAVMAGDFNTWFRESREPIIKYVENFFKKLEIIKGDIPKIPRKRYPLFPDRLVDYQFFRIPEKWKTEKYYVNDYYGSDHYPFITNIIFR